MVELVFFLVFGEQAGKLHFQRKPAIGSGAMAAVLAATVAVTVAAQTAAPIATQMEAGKDAFFEAAKSGKSDDQIKALAEQQGSLRSRMLALQAQTFSKMWTLLESDQKSKVDRSIYGYIEDFLSDARQPATPTPAVEPPGR